MILATKAFVQRNLKKNGSLKDENVIWIKACLRKAQEAKLASIVPYVKGDTPAQVPGGAPQPKMSYPKVVRIVKDVSKQSLSGFTSTTQILTPSSTQNRKDTGCMVRGSLEYYYTECLA